MKQFMNGKKVKYAGAMAGVFDPGSDAEIILGKQYDESFYATSCAYLFRRFGPTHTGCDPYKDLTMYRLTTQMEGVVLLVRPCCSVSTSFGYLLAGDLYEKTVDAMVDARGQEIDIMDCPIRRPVIDALCLAIKELLQPVNVRDWHFNVLGRVNGADLKYDDEEGYLGIAEYSEFAGYGISLDYFDKFKEIVE